MNSWIQNLAILIGLLLIAGAAYFIFVQQGMSLNTGNSNVDNAELQAETQTLLQRLNELRSLDLSTDIYSSDRFQGLTNYTQTPQPQSTGRDNPFASNQ